MAPPRQGIPGAHGRCKRAQILGKLGIFLHTLASWAVWRVCWRHAMVAAVNLDRLCRRQTKANHDKT